MSGSAYAMICPNCGGQVEFAAGQYQANCKFCGTLVERERPPEPQKFVIQTPTFTPTTYIDVSRTSRAGLWVGLIIVVVTFAILGIVFAAVGGSGGSSLFNSAYATSSGILVSGGDGQLPDVLLLIHDNNSDKSGLLFASASQKKVLWQNTDFDKDTYSAAMTSNSTTVYAANKSKLLAYNRADGKAAWQAQLSDVPACDTCVQAIGPAVIALAKDGSLQAFDGPSGKPLWSWRLNSTPRQLIALPNQVAAMDQEGSDTHLSFFDVSTGKEVRRLSPKCVDTQNNESDTLAIYSSYIFVDPADQSLYMFYGSFATCVQRWDSGSGKMLWSTAVKSSSFSFDSGAYPLQTADAMYFNFDHGLVTLDKKTGTLQPLVSNAEYDILPLAVKDSTLILRAKRQRGSTRFELWGFDLTSKQVTWQLPFDNSAEPFEEPDKMAGLIDNTSPGFDAHLTSSGLSVVVAQAQPNKLTTQALNPQTGKTVGDQLSIGINTTGDFYEVPDVIGWYNDYGYFVIDSRLYIINVATGDTLLHW